MVNNKNGAGAQPNEEEIGGQLFKFVYPGDEIAGEIVASDQVEIDGKDVTRVTLQDDEGVSHIILLTENLRQKLLGLPAGTSVRIVYESQQELKGGRRFRNFRVFKVNA